MVSEKYRKLIDRLFAHTAQRQIEWKEAVASGSFQVSFHNNSVIISERPRPDGSDFPPPDITLSILNSSGNLVDTIYNFEIDEGAERPYYLKMRDLYRMVRQQVLKADKAVDEILNELGR
jgi:hypothetical protein